METAEPAKDRSNLDAVIARYVDSRDGYAHAADLVDETDLRSAFLEISKNRAAIAERLADQVSADLEEISEQNGTLEGAAHRWWMGIRESMSSEELRAILSECVRGERVLANALRKSVENDSMKEETRELLRDALNDVERAIENFKFAGVDL